MRYFSLLFFVIVLQFSCEKEPIASKDELTTQEQKWVDQKIENYEFTLQITCFCIREYTLPKQLIVKNKKLVSVDGVPVEDLNDPAFRTIEGYFDLIREIRKQTPDKEAITFDPEMGYPTSIFFDLSFQMADEEINYSISNLTALN